jgi:hypothetical protein
VTATAVDRLQAPFAWFLVTGAARQPPVRALQFEASAPMIKGFRIQTEDVGLPASMLRVAIPAGCVANLGVPPVKTTLKLLVVRNHVVTVEAQFALSDPVKAPMAGVTVRFVFGVSASQFSRH